MSEWLTSNQINDRLLDACLDAECFRLVWAHVKFGGWEEDREVFLSTEFIKRWGMNKSTVKRHRKHLIERLHGPHSTSTRAAGSGRTT